MALDQAEYTQRVGPLQLRYEELKADAAKVHNQIVEKAGRRRSMEVYLQRIRSAGPLDAFDESVFTGTVDQVIVFRGNGKNQKRLIFRFKDGTEVPITI